MPPTAEAGGFLFGSVLFRDALIIHRHLVRDSVLVIDERLRHAHEELVRQYVELLGDLVVAAIFMRANIEKSLAPAGLF